MTTLLTLPDPQPSYSSSPETSFTTSVIRFGDGYTQRVPLGLNSVKRTWNLVWSGLDLTVVQTMANFLRDTKGATAFYWTPPGDLIPTKWICVSFRGPTYLEGGRIADLSAIFEEVFDL